MPNYKRGFMFVVIFSFALLQSARAIKCYVCGSFTSPECLDPFDDDLSTFEDECDYNRPYCVKYKFFNTYPDYGEELRRGCGTEDFCYTNPEAIHFESSESCSMCTSNLCNLGFTAVPSFFTVALLLFSCWFLQPINYLVFNF